MKTCVSSAKISVLVNGSPTSEFCPQRGLRQGDPLSPFLFNIVAEGLNILLSRARQLGLIQGAVVGSSGLRITHLQFADDTILFCNADKEEVGNIKRILRCFEIVSGLRINYHKSVICGIGVDDGSMQEFASSLNCCHHKLPLKYLGLPLGANPSRRSTWKPVLDKFKQKLSTWKRRLLSFAGRLTLIKSVMSNLPIYYLSLFRIPAGVAKEIERIQSAFLWGGSDLRRKIHMVRWEVVSKNKNLGGLGLRRIKSFNQCLLLKWWWRFGVENKSLWKEVICSKYVSLDGRWTPQLISRESKIWSDIIQAVMSNPELHHFYISNAQIVLGDGRRARFWRDKSDELIWGADPSNTFSVSSVYFWSESHLGPILPVAASIWNNFAPPKVQCFGWMAWLGKIKTSSFLHRIGILTGNVNLDCVFCHNEIETVEHILLMKKLEKKIWKVLPLAILWSTWKHRNDCIFNGSQPNLEDLCEIVKVRVAMWLKASPTQVEFSINDLVFNLSQFRVGQVVMAVQSWPGNRSVLQSNIAGAPY
ncbi:uncharacterized protein LOC114311295 [Camellia sinensis]|uniref:uncharacterized protein LOC114311295 n=1 Tax=Camellia sinensis TaxID=4442 RepID=UPI001035CFA2|nr:uncharacterized protein LOC114311295 [Camellia sinensis]